MVGTRAHRALLDHADRRQQQADRRVALTGRFEGGELVGEGEREVTDLGDGVYQWEMQKVGTAQVNIQTIYASKYASDAAKGTVKWTPVKGIGNALVGGSWKIADHKGKSTKVVLKIDGTVDVPVPGLMKMVVAPGLEGEFEKLVDKYIANLIKRFGGEA